MKKHSNDEGSFTKLPSGKWRGQIMVGYSEEGKKIIKSFTAPTKAEVRKQIHDYQAQEHPVDTDRSFAQVADAWYADYRTEVAESTYWNYGFTLGTLKNYFKDKLIGEIKQLDINRGKPRSVELAARCNNRSDSGCGVL